jgi:hypothetical protein
MKISNRNSFGFIVANHPVIKVNATPQVPSNPPRFTGPKKELKKKS